MPIMLLEATFFATVQPNPPLISVALYGADVNKCVMSTRHSWRRSCCCRLQLPHVTLFSHLVALLTRREPVRFSGLEVEVENQALVVRLLEPPLGGQDGPTFWPLQRRFPGT